ncbi:hypothetical protein BDV98DRAFT_515640, partial [Pterulicium gracile]
SLKIWLSHVNCPERVVNETMAAMDELHPEDGPLPRMQELQNIDAELTGIRVIESDMCDNNCLAFTGPLRELLRCPL